MIGNGLFKQLEKWMGGYCYYCEIMMLMTKWVSAFLDDVFERTKAKSKKPYQIISQAKQKVLLLSLCKDLTPLLPQCIRFRSYLPLSLCHPTLKTNSKKRSPSKLALHARRLIFSFFSLSLSLILKVIDQSFILFLEI